jgi:outer membrane protein insertion porin family
MKRRTALLCVFVLIQAVSFLPCAWASGQITTGEIKEIRVKGLRSISRQEFIYLLCLDRARQVVASDIARGIKRAFKKGIFEYISVSEDPLKPGVVIIEVKEKTVIESIDFEGALGIEGGFLKDHFPVKQGDFLREELIGPAATTLTEALVQRGYPEAQVNVEVIREPPYRAKLRVHINEGSPLVVSGIDVIGRPRDEVLRHLGFREGDIYDEFKLRKGMEKLKSFYKKKGYLNPVIGPYSYYQGRLYLNVRPGDMLKISFDGNSEFGARKLRGLMPFPEAGDFRADLVMEAVEKIKSLYRENGYPFLQVAPVVRTEKGVIELQFFIYEGERVKVRSIAFKGSHLPAKQIRKLLALDEGAPFDPSALDDDLQRIKGYYESLGYLDAVVKEPKVNIEDSKADITYQIEEGGEYTINSVKLEGVKSFSPGELERLIPVRPGSAYNALELTNAKYSILDFYNDRGYADCEVDLVPEFTGRTATITFRVTEGRPFRFGKHVIVGNERTKLKLFDRELAGQDGEPFSQKELLKSRQRLYQLGIFSDVNTDVIERYDGTLDVAYDVKEAKAGSVEFGVGYGEYEKERGFAQLSYRNIYGMGNSGSVRLEGSTLEKQIIFNYNEPWFLGLRLPFRAYLLRQWLDEKNFDTGLISYRLSRYSANAGVEKKFAGRLKVQLYYEFSLVSTTDVAPDIVLSREDEGTLAISALHPGVVYDSRDNPFDPHGGIFAGASLKLATSALFSQTNFGKLVLQASKYVGISRPFVLAGSARVGLAEGYSNTSALPIVERFFLGGRDSVRGYDQDTLGPKGANGDPVGGNAFTCFNMELRSTVMKDWEVVNFVDAGNVWPTASQISLKQLRFTTGLGLRYKTPVGPIRLDYGIKLSRLAGESKGVLHFSIGQAF